MIKSSMDTMDEGSEQANRPQFTAGREKAIFLSYGGILERAWDETLSISNNNDNTYFRRSEYEGDVFIAFPSFYIGDFIAGDIPYEQCNIQNENSVFSASLKSDDDKPALVHKGALNLFIHILRNSDLETQVDTISKQRKEQTIIFVGHSIGGAIATLATIWVLGKRLKNISANCITFGSPLVGDTVLMESIDREDWSGNFCHVVSQHDIVPRMVLAPLITLEAHRTVVGNINYLGESSPYKPIGTYMFCSIYGAACIEDPQVVLKMPILTLQNAAENGVTDTFISEHTSYGDLLKHVIESGYSTRTSNISSESSIDMGIALQLEAMGFQTQNNSAFDALKEAEDLKNKYEMDIETLNKELSTSQGKLAEVEWYIKRVTMGNSDNSYNVFKDMGQRRDFHVSENRIYLQNFWNGIIKMVQNHQLPSNFRFLNKWINAGTTYRRLVEPLDIADFYRRQSNNGSYLSIENRPVCHRVLEKWLHDKNLTRIESGRRDRKPRTIFASLTEDSCFWARVEEAWKDLLNLQQEHEQHQTINAHLMETLESFEVRVSKMIEEKSISEEVFLEQSCFMIWCKEYRKFQLKYPGWKSSFPLLEAMKSMKLGV